MRGGVHSVADWAKLLGGFGILFALLQGSAALLRSLRGEAGLVVAAITVGATLVLLRILFAPSWREAALSAGLGAPRWRGIWAALGASGLMLCAYPIFLMTAGGGASIYPNAAWLALGLFEQAGIAEEIVFRGYLYNQIRRGRTFWRAAFLSTIPFTTAHLYLFTTMDWPVALAAVMLSVLVSFPLAFLYDLGGGTIWAPAIAHTVIQGAIKLLVIHDPMFPIVWMAASLAAMWLVFGVSSSVGSRS